MRTGALRVEEERLLCTLLGVDLVVGRMLVRMRLLDLASARAALGLAVLVRPRPIEDADREVAVFGRLLVFGYVDWRNGI